MEKVTAKIGEIKAKPYSNKELCEMYGVCNRTMTKWLYPFKEEVGEKLGRYYTIRQVQTIFNHLGEPYIMLE